MFSLILSVPTSKAEGIFCRENEDSLASAKVGLVHPLAIGTPKTIPASVQVVGVGGSLREKLEPPAGIEPATY